MNSFANIIGQDPALKLLQTALGQDNMSHAYLFTGPSGVGKMFTALTWAWQIIAKTDKEAHIFRASNQHPDLLIIEKLPDKTVIIKEQITEIMEPWIALKPYRAKRRIIIIRDSHLMRTDVANALLKTLEEPPFYTVIILVADQGDLLETIISRCQVVRFFPIADHLMTAYLVAQEIPPLLAEEVAKLAGGDMPLALRLASEEDLREKWHQARLMFNRLNNTDAGQVLSVAEIISSDHDLYINMLETIIRDIIIYKTTNDQDFIISVDNISLADKLEMGLIDPLKEALKEINELKKHYRRNVNSLLISISIARNIWQALNYSFLRR